MAKIKQIIKEIPVIGDLAKTIYRILKSDKNTPTFWINKYLKDIELTVVQIGSNDGITGDPIFELIKKNKRWKVLFVEPVPYLFEKLKKSYGQESRFIFENIAINNGSKQVFYSVNEEVNKQIPNLPNWYDQLGSFYRENIVKHLNGVLEPYILETEVDGLSLSSFFKRNGVDNVTLLHIDTEGYDYKILSQLNLKQYHPTIILFENKHLQDLEKKESILLLRNGYYIFEFDGDFLCIMKSKINKRDSLSLKRRLINENENQQ